MLFRIRIHCSHHVGPTWNFRQRKFSLMRPMEMLNEIDDFRRWTMVTRLHYNPGNFFAALDPVTSLNIRERRNRHESFLLKSSRHQRAVCKTTNNDALPTIFIYFSQRRIDRQKLMCRHYTVTYRQKTTSLAWFTADDRVEPTELFPSLLVMIPYIVVSWFFVLLFNKYK